VADLPDRRPLAALAPARLQTIPDVGKTSALVISEALGRRVPEYLAQPGGPRPTGRELAASELLARLRGDCHSHSDWSDGGSPIREMAEAARASATSTGPSPTTAPG
jgi:putative hydrolase